MTQLSKRAEQYLSTLYRDKEWHCSREQVISYLEKQNLGLIKPIARFESGYSGLDLTIKNQPSEKFFLRLFSVDQIKDGDEIVYIDYNGQKLFDCGYHQTAQYNFYINERGSILVEINDDYYLELYSSVELMIEIYALFDSLPPDVYSSYTYQIKDFDDLMLNLLYGNFMEIRDCCDTQNQIFRNGELIVYLSPYWDEGDKKCVRIFGSDKKICETLVTSFRKNNLIF